MSTRRSRAQQLAAYGVPSENEGELSHLMMQHPILNQVREASERLGLSELLSLQDQAEIAASSADAKALEQELEGQTSAAAHWTRANLLKFSGAPVEGLSVLERMPELPWGDLRTLRWLAIANLRADLGREDASLALRRAVASASALRMLQQADRTLRRLKRVKLAGNLRPYRIALLSTFTADLLPPLIRPMLFESQVDAEFWVAPFHQVHRTILSDDPKLAEFKPDLVMLATDWRAIGESQTAEEYVAGLKDLWDVIRSRYSAAVVQFNCELPVIDPLGRLRVNGPRQRSLESINRKLWDLQADQPGVLILDVDGIASEFGKSRWADPAAWEMSRQYPSTEALPVLARHTAALIRAILGLSSKCLVLDLDGTLWGGVIGEDGIAGIKLGGSGVGAAYVEFQRYVKGLKDRGVLLAVCSKNNLEDAQLPFREHPEMILKEPDISVFRVNWEPKEANLRAIAESSNISLDSLVFLDDNPAERERVRQELPMVEVPELPEEPALYAKALHETLRFEALRVTNEDLLRSESIHSNVQRESLAREAGSAEAYLHGLQMAVTAQPFTEIDLGRIVQLFNKTNQFNLTTRRITDVQAREWMNSADTFTLSVRLKDRFGEFGLTGLMVAVQDGNSLKITDWLISCRILGRGVEQCMLALARVETSQRGCAELIGEFIPTAKNQVAADIYQKFGFQAMPGSGLYRFDVAEATIDVPPYLSLDEQLASVRA